MTESTLKPYVDVVVIVPLPEEFRRLELIFPPTAQFTKGTNVVSELSVGNSSVRVVALLQEEMGKSAAIIAADNAASMYEIGVFVVLGIAGGLSKDLKIGDVCISTSVIDVLDKAKTYDTSGGIQITAYSPTFGHTDAQLVFSMKYVSIGLDVRPSFEDWQLRQYEIASNRLPGEFRGKGGKNEKIDLPDVRDGAIVCGNVSQSESYSSAFQQYDRKILAIETELGGVFYSASRNKIPVIAVRGVSDYADGNKTILEDETASSARTIAADNAVSFLSLQLRNPQFLLYLERRRDQSAYSTSLLDRADAEIQFADQVRAEARQTIHDHLTLLSPEYQGKPDDYQVPLPRVRFSSTASVGVGPAKKRDVEPLSVLEAVAANRLITLEVPRSYPDRSLPWAIAAALEHIEINGRQAVPLIIDGSAVRPPHGTLARGTNLDLDGIHSSSRVRPVVILLDLPMRSKGRADHVVAEIEKYPGAHFIIIPTRETSVSAESDLILRGATERMSLCDVSFSEIADFVQRSLAISEQQAGVMALRLWRMFRRFSLNAHPSYFARVTADSLHSLLRANRRSELLQFAVGGFLSLVVASDQSKVPLTRTTREEFLRQLTFDLRVEKKKYDLEGLIAYARRFANEADVPIEPIEFIRGFQDRNLINFDESGNCQITLPFIEAYLLATALQHNEAAAEQYFDPSGDDFDQYAFDIYAELGPSSKIVIATTDALAQAVRSLGVPKDQIPIHFTNEIQPHGLNFTTRLDQLNKQLQQAFEDVSSGRANKDDKQRLLDLAAGVEDSARKEQENSRRNSSLSNDEAFRRLDAPFRIWSRAVLLLGSGGERIPREVKRKLAAEVADATATLTDELLRAFPRGLFDGLRKRLQGDEYISNLAGAGGNQQAAERFRELIGTLLDTYELSLLAVPFRVVLGHLCNSAGQGALSQTVLSVRGKTMMAELVASLWAAEIDAVGARAQLFAAIDNLPPTPLLRYALYKHLHARVFWTQWDTENRFAMLDAASRALAAMGKRIDTGRVRRAVERASKTKKGSPN